MSLQEWLKLIKKNDNRWAEVERILEPESRGSLNIFKEMSWYGFVSTDSQEGRRKRGKLYFPMNIYLRVFQEILPKYEEEEQKEESEVTDQSVEAFFKRAKRRWKKWEPKMEAEFFRRGGRIMRGTTTSERAYLILVTTKELADYLY